MCDIQYYPSIEQFRNVVKSVRDYCRKNETPLPELTFNGTVKLHGTNAGVSLKGGEFVYLSHKRVICVGDDNYGFAAWMQDRVALLPIEEGCTLYGEFCGQGIQKGVAISELPKMFVAFGYKDAEGNWKNIHGFSPEANSMNMWSINQFPKYGIHIDFSNPEASIEKLTQITEEVERECPVGKYFGVSGVGEGVVWTCMSIPELRFKVKGEKHSSSKVKVLASVDIERVNSLKALVDSVLSENRMQQMYDEMVAEYGEFGNEKLGEFLKRCISDCIKEESDTISASGFEIKDFTKKAPDVAKAWFFKEGASL